MTREVRPVGRFEWEQVMRRARVASLIPASTKIGNDGRPSKGGVSAATAKLVMFTFASYASESGDEIWPGDATVAVDAEVGVKTVVAVKRALIDLGLLTRIRGRVGDRGVEYRLTLPSDLLDHLVVLTPAEHKLASRRVNDSKRGPGSVGSGGPPDEPGSVGSAGPHEPNRLWGPPDHADDESGAGSVGSAGPTDLDSVGSAGPVLWGPPDPLTNQDQPVRSTNHSDSDLGTASCGPRASPAAPKPEISDCRCSRGYVLSPDGSAILHCPDCQPSNVIPFRRPA